VPRAVERLDDRVALVGVAVRPPVQDAALAVGQPVDRDRVLGAAPSTPSRSWRSTAAVPLTKLSKKPVISTSPLQRSWPPTIARPGGTDAVQLARLRSGVLIVVASDARPNVSLSIALNAVGSGNPPCW
jgi:hypothetical protein